ncbi:hypothetical protein ACQP10_20380 [Streptosporangium sandarakinum]|uniref:hypothetical protein n=1 Tax=Streptosporangium sandarakinum TaxID=1260955 RepID=UPI003D908CA5
MRSIIASAIGSGGGFAPVRAGARRNRSSSAPLPGDEVGRDAVQPRPGRRLRVIVGGATAEGGQERLRHDIVGNLHAQPPRDIPVDLLDIPVEHAGELLRIVN